MATASGFNFAPPEQFSFEAADFKDWLRVFTSFHCISGLADQSEEVQIQTLLYSMGPRAYKVFDALKLGAADKKKYAKVTEAFEQFYVPKVNIIFERANFNQRVQQQGETVDAFISDLHELAKKCSFQNVTEEELIRDRIVIGIRDAKLSERLQLDENLTLETAITKAKQAEMVHNQQDVVRNATSNMETMHIANLSKKKTQATGAISKVSQTRKPQPTNQKCHKCGNKEHPNIKCPAANMKCNFCKKKGHFAKCCFKAKQGSHQVSEVTPDYSESLFLGHINGGADPWTVEVQIAVSEKVSRSIKFTIDSGADITCLSSAFYNKAWGQLKHVKQPFKVANGGVLNVKGRIKVLFAYKAKKSQGYVYFIDNLSRPLLGRKEICNLNVLKLVMPISSGQVDTEKEKWVNKFPELFKGLGHLPYRYKITLKENAEPLPCLVARKVSLPLLPKVEKALTDMVNLGVIEKVDEPTDWCAPMVVVKKPDSEDVRITTDFTELNRAVKRELFELPSVDFVLGQLGEPSGLVN